MRQGGEDILFNISHTTISEQVNFVKRKIAFSNIFVCDCDLHFSGKINKFDREDKHQSVIV